MPTPVKSDPSTGPFSLGLSHALFVAAFASRLWNLVRLTHSPLLVPTRGDMHFYNDWAKEILHGQCAQHLAFYGLPGYAYLLAFLYKIFGENPFIPGLLQAAVDAGIAVLIYQIYVRTFGATGLQSAASTRLTGLVAALGWTFFIPAQAYSVVLMPTAWFVFVFWFVLWRIIRRDDAPSAWECLLLSLLVGATASAVATILAIVPLMLAALLLKSRAENLSVRPLIVRIALLLLGIVLGTSPCWMHNYFIARDPVVLSAHSGINLWIGNNPEANGYPRFPPGLRAGQAAMLEDSITQAEAASGRSLKHSEVSAYWSDQAKAFIGSHPSDWLKLIGRKLWNFWSAFQYDDLSIVTSLREQRIIVPGIYFGVVAAFAIPGIFFAVWHTPRSRWILAAILLSMFAILAVFVTERYRLVAAPGLLIFAAFGLTILWQALTSLEGQTTAIYLALLASAAFVVAWPQRNPSLWALDAYNSGWQALEANNLPMAEEKLAIAYAYVPDNSETLFALGNLRLAQNDPSAAQSFYRAVLNLNPLHKGAFNNLGVIALDVKNYDEAENYFRRAEDIDPRNAKTHFLLAKALVGQNNRQAAKIEIDTALRLKPEQAEFQQLREELQDNAH